MKLTGYGIREWLGSGIIALALLGGVVFIFPGNPVIRIILALLIISSWTCIAAFFRSPRRNIPANDHLIVSPADGIIQDIEVFEANKLEFSNEFDMVRIGIFLSVLDVHINRVPVAMTVTGKVYRKGKKHDARSLLAKVENESMMLFGEFAGPGSKLPVAVRQISGAIARRIVCPVMPGANLMRGTEYGMIKLGSRTELYLPVCDDISVKVAIGQKVYAGSSVVAEVTD
tara:strand:- start:50 stop:736 length:687 start_codon:yes stop_codon:yes gene_type:complete